MGSHALVTVSHHPRSVVNHGATGRGRFASTVAVMTVVAAALAILTWTWVSLRPSSAAFADQQQIIGNHLGAGTLDVAFGNATTAFAATNLAPGDVASGRLVVENRGDLAMRYRLSASNPAVALRDVIEIVAWNGSGQCPTTPPPTTPTWAPLDSSGDAGSALTGRLAPGESQLVCLGASLPAWASNEVQGKRLAFTIIASAEHDVRASPSSPRRDSDVHSGGQSE